VSPGRRLGVDVGLARIGVALSDPRCILATPLATISAGETSVADVAALAEEHEVVEIAVGLPLLMSGQEGSSAAMAREWADALRERLPQVPVVLIDERLTTVVATRALRDSGRKTKTHKPVVDQAAAVELLQTHLDRIRSAS
jgi:putative Holliday junction resolvase